MSGIDFVKIPLADGGEGTVETVLNFNKGRLIRKAVSGPFGDRIIAEYAILDGGKTAVMEMASACGISLLSPSQYNPLMTTTSGLGELILSALDEGCSKIIIGLGGSATNDGGAGAAHKLGFRFLDINGKTIVPIAENLSRIYTINTESVDNRIKSTKFIAAVDVMNPLTGHQGASYVYAGQKGATPEQILILEKKLKHYARIIKTALGVDIEYVPGSGAAGGLGGGMIAFLNAGIVQGIDLIMQMIEFTHRISNADLIITGEGKLDKQSLYGKVVSGICLTAQKMKIPVIVIAGKYEDWKIVTRKLLCTKIIEITPENIAIASGIDDFEQYLEQAVEKIIDLIKKDN